ncbi:MAG: hypothetical protein ACI9DO_002096 [Reinekea sp.]|jgi:hypothetical protein
MTTPFRTLLAVLMFGLFLSNNIIVPIHQQTHIAHDHESTHVDCDTYHASHVLALSTSDYSAYFPPILTSIATPVVAGFGAYKASTKTQIRAPPVLA